MFLYGFFDRQSQKKKKKNASGLVFYNLKDHVWIAFIILYLMLELNLR